ncbi:hypothetical protein TNCV_2626691 [Trichonephila clavipes]|uniref:Uncharacterized protein n=1 Tax=Trichonephila clavipes TaxID=2585209 RepID=A0A8X6W718_TRICX|nr:hypothetical protein TNCV_2626691 [Trichonephila clavipes]
MQFMIENWVASIESLRSTELEQLQVHVELMPEPDKISNLIEEVVDLVRQMNLEVDSDGFQEPLDSHGSRADN